MVAFRVGLAVSRRAGVYHAHPRRFNIEERLPKGGRVFAASAFRQASATKAYKALLSP
jgi:hypothetical protein